MGNAVGIPAARGNDHHFGRNSGQERLRAGSYASMVAGFEDLASDIRPFTKDLFSASASISAAKQPVVRGQPEDERTLVETAPDVEAGREISASMNAGPIWRLNR
jgi:hypothetical protein